MGTHLPGAPLAWKAIRIEHLIRHTSGIPDYESAMGLGSAAYDEFMGKPKVPERIYAWAARTSRSDFEPGTQFRYSNTAYVVLGMILESATKKPLDDLLQSEIAGPLQLRSTLMERTGKALPDLARGYRMDEPERRQYYAGLDLASLVRPAAAMHMTPPQGDAGLVTTAADLFHMDQHAATRRFLDRR